MFAKRVFVCLVRLPKKVCGTVPAAAARYVLSAEREEEREGKSRTRHNHQARRGRGHERHQLEPLRTVLQGHRQTDRRADGQTGR